MKKLSFVLPVYLVIMLFSSCEPARPGGGDFAPTSNTSGEVNEAREVVEGKADSSVEKALIEAHDSIQAKQ